MTEMVSHGLTSHDTVGGVVLLGSPVTVSMTTVLLHHQ